MLTSFIYIIIAFIIPIGIGVGLCWLIIYWKRQKPKVIGDQGEREIKGILEGLPSEYKAFNNVVMTNKKSSTQIDHIVVSKYGVFVIETKNYLGDIYGNDDREKWTQMIVNDVTYASNMKTYTYVTKNHMYNPVKQCRGHMFAVKRILERWPYLPVVPIVVFTNRANISNITTRGIVINKRELAGKILSYKTQYLTDDDVRDVCKLIDLYNVNDYIDEKTHVENIESARNARFQIVRAGKCPECGGLLVKREGKFGSFWGCSNYPKCKYTTE